MTNERVIQKLREDIKTLEHNLKEMVPDDDGIILKVGENMLLVMYQGLVELLQREVIRLKSAMDELGKNYGRN